MPKSNFIQLRKANDAKLITYLVCIGLSIIFFFFIMFSLTEEQGYGVLWLLAILIFILFLMFLSAWLPKVVIHIDGDQVIISKGIGINNEVDKVSLKTINKIRFHTYKEATGKGSKYGNIRTGGSVRASGNSIEGSIAIGGAYSVLLMLKNKRQVEFGYYLSKQKAVIARTFIESNIQNSTS